MSMPKSTHSTDAWNIVHSTHERYHMRKMGIRIVVRWGLDSGAEAAVAQTVFVYTIMIDRKGME